MPGPPDLVALVTHAQTWDARVALVRRVPEEFGQAQHKGVYADIAERVYVPNLTPDFGYVHWRDDYELDSLFATFEIAAADTDNFADVVPARLAGAIRSHPPTLRIYRLLLGLTSGEFAEATAMISIASVGKSAVANIEAGARPSVPQSNSCAAVIDQMMSGSLFPPRTAALRSKIEKPDTALGWESVRRYTRDGVPLPVLLHQRHYGGAFRQLLDATSSLRGDLLEDPVEDLFLGAGVPYVRTGSHNQSDIEARFGISVQPAPDFVVYDDRTGSLRAILECKVANDGGTARDKAARFRTLRSESNRLGGIPLFAMLGGIGWRRTNDALGPVVRDTDGRVFTLGTLPEMMHVDPLPNLTGRTSLNEKDLDSTS